MSPRKLRVAVVMGGPSAEYEISIQSGRTMADRLDPSKYEVVPVIIDQARRWLKALHLLGHGRRPTTKAIMPALEHAAGRLDVALLALHSFGEDGTVQGFLETLGIPYTGSGVLASALAMDKHRFKAFCRAIGIPVADSVLVQHTDWRRHREPLIKLICALGSRVVIKPNKSGSSAGVSIVPPTKHRQLARAMQTAYRFDHISALVERYLPGRELTVATIGDDRSPRALPVIEIIPTRAAFFSYDVKYDGSTKEICPAEISRTLANRLADLACQVHRGIGARGAIRTDFIVHRGRPFVLETNTLPGMTTESLVPKAAAAAGLSYNQLLDELIRLALTARHG
ncbi:MAG: D-alanine--D-alanine ligase [Candidatus Kerfeldbacteria bacterium]|nr:D-alanine--D-alanine ligase [Candidatus Kerfeldbacteria bacterium]